MHRITKFQSMMTDDSIRNDTMKSKPLYSPLKKFFKRQGSLKCFLICAICANLIVLYYLAVSQHKLDGHVRFAKSPFEDSADFGEREKSSDSYGEVDIENDLDLAVTFIICDFEDFENEIVKTVLKIRKVLPRAQILVISDHLPYPPLNLPDSRHIHLVVTTPLLDKPNYLAKPEHYLKTKYSVIIPDATIISSADLIRNMVYLLDVEKGSTKIIAAKVVKSDSSKETKSLTTSCLDIDMNIKTWTLKQKKIDSHLCDGLSDDAVLLVRTYDLLTLPQPFAQPFKLAFFTQTNTHGWHVKITTDFSFKRIRDLYEDLHATWKRKTHKHSHLKNFSAKFGIKLVQMSSGQDVWLGCERDTPRCFGTVVDDMPDYIYQGRWTPPCCLRHLRATARHVFNTLQSQDVRYWLEGGSLLGAARNGDIIPWDYDIDIGIYRDDIERSEQLIKCHSRAYQDASGFVWERASEGEFYRVQHSVDNHLHVDIFPFVSRNGTMTKNTWIKTHRQDREFPEHYLHPLTTMQFVGMEVSVPNNVKEFLELKFGKGVIENPQYPSPSKYKETPK